VEEYSNKVEIITLDEETGEFPKDAQCSFTHPYPCTKIMFIPDKECTKEDLLATTGDYLRIWQVSDDNEIQLKSLLNNNKSSEFCAPLTSFDWNETKLQRVGTSSIDTTCTIWDVERECVDTQLIAHESQTPDTPLLRLGWNKQDPRYMATICMDSPVIVLDIRFPTLPVAELQGHRASMNTLAWAPHSSSHMCTAGDDSQALIWDLSSMNQPPEGGLDPILAYSAGAEINQLQWSTTQPDWISIAFRNSLQILRV